MDTKNEVENINKNVKKINKNIVREGINVQESEILNQMNAQINKINNNYNTNIQNVRNIHLNKKDLLKPIGVLDPEGKENNPLTGEPYNNLYKNNNNPSSKTYKEWGMDMWSKLPMYKQREEALKLLYDNQVVLIVSGTGSGKTVLTPKFLLHVLNYQGRIAITNPKRAPTRSNAEFAAMLLDVKYGEEVGYKISGDSKYDSQKTKLVFCTDGLVMANLRRDPLLSDYDGVIIDEAHERNINIDLLLLLLRDLVVKRPDFKLVIMSATINIKLFSDYFPKPIKFGMLEADSGTHYPVEEFYLDKPILKFDDNILISRPDDYIIPTVKKVIEILSSTDSGDILVFLTAGSDCGEACNLLGNMLSNINQNRAQKLFCTILVAGVGKEAENLAKSNTKYKDLGDYTRKVIMANEVAESSITFKGIEYVIDCGLYKVNIFYNETNIDALEARRISKAAHLQRKGRTGRTGPGTCYNMFTKEEYKDFVENTPAPICIENISSSVLRFFADPQFVSHLDLPFKYSKVKKKLSKEIKPLELGDFLDKFIQRPSEETVRVILKRLYALGVWDIKDKMGIVTPLGRAMAKFGESPMMSRALIAGYNYKCRNELCDLAAILQVSEGRVEMIFNQFKSKSKNKKNIEAEKKLYEKVKKSWFNRLGDQFSLLDIYQEYSLRKYGRKRRDGSYKVQPEDPEKVGEWCRKNYLKKNKLAEVKRISSQFNRTFGDVIRIAREDNAQKNIDYIFVDEKPKISEKIEENILRAITKGFYINIASHIHGTKFLACFPPKKSSGELDRRMSFFVQTKQMPKYILYTEFKRILGGPPRYGVTARVTPNMLSDLKEGREKSCLELADCKPVKKQKDVKKKKFRKKKLVKRWGKKKFSKKIKK